MDENLRDKTIYRSFGITQNELKMIAVVSMIIDHIGEELFPHLTILRIMGRLAFPIFSYCIFEGCRHTHNKRRYLLQILLLGILCVIGYYIFSGEIYGNILITFSLSICVLYAFCYFKQRISGSVADKCIGCALFLFTMAAAYALCTCMYIDYGFCGVMLPVLAELSCELAGKKSEKYRFAPIVGFSIGLVVLSFQMGVPQWFSLFSLPLLLAYNGSRGERNMKSFFYWFYPAHLMAIGLISIIM